MCTGLKYKVFAQIMQHETSRYAHSFIFFNVFITNAQYMICFTYVYEQVC